MVDEADELNDTDPHEGRGNQVRSMGPRDIAQASLFADIVAAEVATLRSQLAGPRSGGTNVVTAAAAR